VPGTAAACPAAILTSAVRDAALRDRAAALGRRLAAAGGPERAADVVEQAAGHGAAPAARQEFTPVQPSATSRENHEYAISRPAHRGRGAGPGGRAAVDTGARGLS
jgi:hypothetical protein